MLSSSPCNLVRALRLRSRGGRAGCFGGVISAGWSSAGRWSAGRWSAGVEDLQTERVAGRASCRESELQGERVVLVESLLQVGALLGDGRGAGGVGAVGGTAGPAYAFSLLSVVFVVALICLCLRLCFIVIVICFCLLRAGLDKVGMKNAC